jgi:hypothetical protein
MPSNKTRSRRNTTKRDDDVGYPLDGNEIRPARSPRQQMQYDVNHPPAGISETLRRIEDRLSAPVLNGGFSSLVNKVDQIAEHAKVADEVHAKLAEKLDKLSDTLLDPVTGVIVKTNSLDAFISTQRWMIRGLIAVGGGAVLIGILAWIVSTLTRGAVQINR